MPGCSHICAIASDSLRFTKPMRQSSSESSYVQITLYMRRLDLEACGPRVATSPRRNYAGKAYSMDTTLDFMPRPFYNRSRNTTEHLDFLHPATKRTACSPPSRWKSRAGRPALRDVLAANAAAATAAAAASAASAASKAASDSVASSAAEAEADTVKRRTQLRQRLPRPPPPPPMLLLVPLLLPAAAA